MAVTANENVSRVAVNFGAAVFLYKESPDTVWRVSGDFLDIGF